MDKIKFETKELKDFSEEQWETILLSFNSSIQYTYWYLNYVEILNEHNCIENYSYLIYKDSLPLAIVPLYTERVDSAFQFSIGQETIPAPLFSKHLNSDEIINSVYISLIKKMELIAIEKKCRLARFYYPIIPKEKAAINYFRRFNFSKEIKFPNWYIFKANHSIILNLEKEIDVLFSGVRNRYKSYVNKTLNKTQIEILDSSNFNDDLFNEFKNFYYQIKGNKRSNNAFKLDLDAIKKGLEIVLICKYHEKIIGAIAIHCFNGISRYNSSLRLANCNEKIYPIHGLIWKAITYLKDRGFCTFEIGEYIEKNAYSKDIDKKFIGISEFKSGWGGNLYPINRAQKKYNDAK